MAGKEVQVGVQPAEAGGKSAAAPPHALDYQPPPRSPYPPKSAWPYLRDLIVIVLIFDAFVFAGLLIAWLFRN